MLFNTYSFIFIFLPITLAVYYILNRLGKNALSQYALIIASFVFYGFGDPRLCLLLLASVLVNFGMHRAILNAEKNKKLLVVIGIILNLAPLFYFKYLNFSIRIINKLSAGNISPLDIALPLGISFFTFQQISALVDSAKEDAEKFDFREYALFVSFFPQLVAGPIALHSEMIPQFEEKAKHSFNAENFQKGILYFFTGLSKKVLIADRFAAVADAGFVASGLNSLSAIIVILSYTLQIYFDFSGYCDMALGLGYMFNIQLPINFNSPYKAANISEFWDRWHMTLTRFLTKYVYIPLGGSRKGYVRTLVNILIVFFVSGLWHGASTLFIFWGLMHGVAMVIYRIGRKFFDKIPRIITGALTFIFVSLAWVFFRAEYFEQAVSLILHGLRGGIGGVSSTVSQAFYGGTILESVLSHFISGGAVTAIEAILSVAWIVFGLLFCFILPSSHEMVEKQSGNRLYKTVLVICAAWCVVRFSQFSSFIYFNF